MGHLTVAIEVGPRRHPKTGNRHPVRDHNYRCRNKTTRTRFYTPAYEEWEAQHMPQPETVAEPVNPGFLTGRLGNLLATLGWSLLAGLAGRGLVMTPTPTDKPPDH